MKTVKTFVNCEAHNLEVEPHELLVHVLRDRLNLTGTHVGCDTTQCGAWTVRIDDKAVKSCTVLAVEGGATETPVS